MATCFLSKPILFHYISESFSEIFINLLVTFAERRNINMRNRYMISQELICIKTNKKIHLINIIAIIAANIIFYLETHVNSFDITIIIINILVLLLLFIISMKTYRLSENKHRRKFLAIFVPVGIMTGLFLIAKNYMK